MARAFAHTNIALIKYWGKRPGARRDLNLPAVGSLSLTLDVFGSDTRVVLTSEETDTFVLDGQPASPEESARVSAFLDLVRYSAGRTERAAVTSINHVPTAAGLASSASAFAALALAAPAAYGLALTTQEQSMLARQGSGSAGRSVYGGFVQLHRGTRDDGADCFAEPIQAHPTLEDVRLLVVKCGVGRKAVGSTHGMDHVAATSAYFPAWVETHPADLTGAVDALTRGDIHALGTLMEHNTLKMHATTLAAQPGFSYLLPTTWIVLDEVRRIRESGTPAYFTMDAGPHVKVLCFARDWATVAERLKAVPGTHGVDVAAPGPAARLLRDPK